MSERADNTLLLTFARRGEEDAIRGALGALQSARPEAAVFAVATLESEGPLRALGVDDLVVLDASRSALAVLREAAERRPAAAAIVYSDDTWRGHLKLEIVALWSRARTVYRCGPEERVQEVGRLQLLASVAGKTAQAALWLCAGALAAGTAFCWLRATQLLAGGNRAHRA